MKEITRTPQSGPAKKDRNLTRWLFVAPAMLVVLCLLVYPLCSTLLYSVTNKTLIKSTYAFKGIDNYIKIFTDPAFGKAFHSKTLTQRVTRLGMTGLSSVSPVRS